MRTIIACLLCAGFVLGPAEVASPAPLRYRDVSSSFASAAIDGVAGRADWMRAFDDGTFRPWTHETRGRFAVALVRAFARSAPAPSSLRIADLPSSAEAARAIGVAVARGWMSAPGGAFKPGSALTKADMNVALVRAMGLRPHADALNALRTEDGHRFALPAAFGEMVIAGELEMHHNYRDDDERAEMLPWSKVRRADAAYALWAAWTAMRSPEKMANARRYASISVPAMSREARDAAQWSFQWAGYPYIWGGDWPSPTGRDYAYEPQAQGGFDCSGFVWWTLKRKDSTYAPPRAYAGHPIPHRVTADMARATTNRLRWRDLRAMDVMLFDADDNGVIDHTGMFLGKGWFIHSSANRGVSISSMADPYWSRMFRFGFRVIPAPGGGTAASPPAPAPSADIGVVTAKIIVAMLPMLAASPPVLRRLRAMSR